MLFRSNANLVTLAEPTKQNVENMAAKFINLPNVYGVVQNNNLKLQISTMVNSLTQVIGCLLYTLPDLDPEGIVIPIGKGTGLIQIIDNEHPYQVLPLLCPTSVSYTHLDVYKRQY